jgi:hypothetical protein
MVLVGEVLKVVVVVVRVLRELVSEVRWVVVVKVKSWIGVCPCQW